MNHIDHNQRNFYRCRVSIPFRFSIVRGEEILGPYAGVTIDLGGGGMLFKTSCPLLQPGNLILAEFEESDERGRAVDLDGDFMARVTREVGENERPAGESRGERFYFLAVEFRFPHKADRNDVVAYLNRLEAKRRRR
ncbi:MAG: PilZ domain-containing protein [Deltaproteobacteria bacterium]|nr:PilZ domain-containing protein [Deltaproteobacteria bacterium]